MIHPARFILLFAWFVVKISKGFRILVCGWQRMPWRLISARKWTSCSVVRNLQSERITRKIKKGAKKSDGLGTGWSSEERFGTAEILQIPTESATQRKAPGYPESDDFQEENSQKLNSWEFHVKSTAKSWGPKELKNDQQWKHNENRAVLENRLHVGNPRTSNNFWKLMEVCRFLSSATKYFDNHEIGVFLGKLHEEVQRAEDFKLQGIRHWGTAEIWRYLTISRIMREMHTELRDVSFSPKPACVLLLRVKLCNWGLSWETVRVGFSIGIQWIEFFLQKYASLVFHTELRK